MIRKNVVFINTLVVFVFLYVYQPGRKMRNYWSKLEYILFGGNDVDKELKDAVLSSDFTITARGERFLLWDSRVANSKKPIIIIFASAFGLQLLQKYNRWSMDGTFYSVPKGFKQLYTVNVSKEESTLPCLFMLLPNKSEETYARAFRMVFEKYPQLNLKSMMTAWLISHFSLCSNQMACLAVNPPKLEVSANGGVYNLHLANPGGTRIAFKFRSSNNNDYRLKPVFGFVEAGRTWPVEVTRVGGPPKEDMLIIQFIEVAADVADPQAPFKSGSKCGEVNLPITAK